MNKCKLSIIVPVYGVEKYIDKCLDSLVKQSLKEIEIQQENVKAHTDCKNIEKVKVVKNKIVNIVVK